MFEGEEIMQTEALVNTQSAELYLKKLCRHFAHKVPATIAGQSGIIDFPFGRCRLDVKPGSLVMCIELENADDVDKAEKVVSEHLVRMAPKETLTIEWGRTD